MNIELREISVRELTAGYEDLDESGVIGFSGDLDIRPAFQREFIYKDKQRSAVINTITKDYPLNLMYWSVRDDGKFEVIDGQQRTISVCQYVNGDFSFNDRFFYNLQDNEKEHILDYKIMIYMCSGTDSEKLEWFKTINIAGEKLADQELRNAVYNGSWCSDAKRYFSKRECVAYNIASSYITGVAIRQDYLETALKWISEDSIEAYMANHQNDQNAGALWRYFQSVITWISTTFINTRSGMKGVDWGTLYNQYKDEEYDTADLENETARLIMDDDVTKKSGIYSYLLTGAEKYLNIRAFSNSLKQNAYEQQEGNCPTCEEHFELSQMEADHITPWHEGGKTNENNCQMLCKECNRRKSGR